MRKKKVRESWGGESLGGPDIYGLLYTIIERKKKSETQVTKSWKHEKWSLTVWLRKQLNVTTKFDWFRQIVVLCLNFGNVFPLVNLTVSVDFLTSAQLRYVFVHSWIVREPTAAVSTSVVHGCSQDGVLYSYTYCVKWKVWKRG